MAELDKLLVEELQDLYDAEKQLVKALPKMAKATTYPELKQAFLDHLEMTKNQVTRLEEAFTTLGVKAKSKPCKAMRGLIEEGSEIISEHDKGPELDTALIGAAQKVEHYEISGYGTARALAKALGHKDTADLLDQTAKEEGETDKNLTKVCLQMLKEVTKIKTDMSSEMPDSNGRSKGGSRRSRSAATADM